MAYSDEPLVNWQQHLKSWPDRIAYIKQKDNLSDFKFIVGPKKTIFHAHKLIFAISSPDFENLFYLLKSDMKEIVLADTQPEIFKEFINFVYTGKIVLNTENFVEILRLGRLYDINILVNKCNKFLEENTTKENALHLLELSITGNTNEVLELKALKLISENAIEIFSKPEFTECSRIALGKILDSDTLTCSEITIFEAVNKWAESVCERDQLNVTSEAKMKFVGDLGSKIKFGTMTPGEIIKCSHGITFLTSNEVVKILQFIESPMTSDGVYSKTKRLGQNPLHRSLRFLNGPSKTNGCTLGGKLDINISVSKPIYLCGYGIFGGKPEALAKYSNAIVQTKLSDHKGKLLSENSEKITFDGTERIYDIFFKEPVLLQPFNKYNIWVKRNGPTDIFQNFKGVTGRSEIKENGVVLRITKSLDESFAFNTAAEGPIASIIYKTCH